MATNDILTFAGTSTNILTQAEYAADAQRSSGNVPGVARSKLVNKAARQSAFISSMIGQFIADVGGINVVDDNDVAGLEADFIAALGAFLTGKFSGSAQSLTTNGFQKLPGGLVLQWGVAIGVAANNAGSVVGLPIPFPTAGLQIICCPGGLVASAVSHGGAITSNSQATLWQSGTNPITMRYYALGY